MALRFVWLAVVGIFACGGVAMAGEARMARLKVFNETAHEIDVRLFGQFLERASFGEPGPEPFADPKTGRLPAKIVGMLKAMQIPIIRFPGGTDVDYIDWRDMIDNVPGREGSRPITRSYRPGREEPSTITNRFGYDEYFALRDELKCETILVVNLLDGVAKRRPMDEAANLAAGLVAYANTPVGAKLPAGMPDWPAIRAKNGHRRPFGAEYVQLGNEFFLETIRKQAMEAIGAQTREQLAPWYVEVITAYIKAIRAVDPDVKIILDAWMGQPISDTVQADAYIKANVAYLARHKYAPGGCDKIMRGKETVDPATLTDGQLWWAWVSMPGAVDTAGQNQAYRETLDEYREKGFPIASTEWNWNGWSWQGLTDTFEAPAAAGIGASAFIHGLMRQGDQIKIANQSMLLGSGWAIAAIFADPAGKHEPYYNPQGSATTFYRTNHGRSLLKSQLSGVGTHPQPFSFGWGGGVDNEVAELDVVVTADADRVFIHAINRTFDRDLPLLIDLTDLAPISSAGVHRQLRFHLRGKGGRGVGRGMAHVVSTPLRAAERMTVTVPARTVSSIQIPRGDSTVEIPRP